MKRHTLATLVLLAAMPLVVPAAENTPATTDSGRSAATGSPAAVPPMFKELDKNHDGQISQTEAKRSADVSARFSAIDTDKNKRISLHEWQADEKSHARGAAGVSGESRDLKPQTTSPGDTPKSNPDMNKSGY